MSVTSQITGNSTVCSIVCSGWQKKNRSSTLLAFCDGNHHWSMDSPQQGPMVREVVSCLGITMMGGSWCEMRWNCILRIRHARPLHQPVSLSARSLARFDSCDRPSNLTQIGFKLSIFRPCDLEIWRMIPKTKIRHVFYTTSSFVYHFISINEFKLELQSGNTQSGSN